MDIRLSSLLKDSYGVLWKMIIRPPRADYHIKEMGPTRFRLGRGSFMRADLQLVNERGQRLQCSHFRPIDRALEEGRKKLPCVVYLHGNCSSRCEALDAVQVLLPRNIMVFCLDLSGSGMSEGEYISLGHYEERDVLVVLRHLRESSCVSTIGIWGRSMGAATCILRAAEDLTIAACVLDSPFSDLRIVAAELVSNQVVIVPRFLVNMALQMVRKEVQSRANFDITELLPIKGAPKAKSPALFAVAQDDDFVLPHHTLDLYEAWGGQERHFVKFDDGGHNGVRPQWFLDQAAEFLQQKLEEKPKLAAPSPLLAMSDVARLSLPPPAPWEGDDCPTGPPMPPDDPVAALPVAAPRSIVRMSGPHTNLKKNASQHSSCKTLEKKPKASQTSEKPLCVPATTENILASKLVSMGFDRDTAEQAAKTHSTAEAAVDWLVQESTHILQESAQALNAVKLQAPQSREFTEGAVTEGLSGAADSRHSATLKNTRIVGSTSPNMDGSAKGGSCGQSAPCSLRASPPQGRDEAKYIIDKLVDIGFSHDVAMAAARRYSTVEDAVDWLIIPQNFSIRL